MSLNSARSRLSSCCLPLRKYPQPLTGKEQERTENGKYRPKWNAPLRSPLIVDSSSHSAWEESLETLLTKLREWASLCSESTKVSIKNRDFRLWKTIANLLTDENYIPQAANTL